MSDQSHSCDPRNVSRERTRFLCYGALSIALAVGFGYSMASMRYQDAFAVIAETTAKEFTAIAERSAKERASLHNRYMRQLGKKDKEIAALIGVCRIGVSPK